MASERFNWGWLVTFRTLEDRLEPWYLTSENVEANWSHQNNLDYFLLWYESDIHMRKPPIQEYRWIRGERGNEIILRYSYAQLEVPMHDRWNLVWRRMIHYTAPWRFSSHCNTSTVLLGSFCFGNWLKDKKFHSLDDNLCRSVNRFEFSLTWSTITYTLTLPIEVIHITSQFEICFKRYQLNNIIYIYFCLSTKDYWHILSQFVLNIFTVFRFCNPFFSLFRLIFAPGIVE